MPSIRPLWSDGTHGAVKEARGRGGKGGSWATSSLFRLGCLFVLFVRVYALSNIGAFIGIVMDKSLTCVLGPFRYFSPFSRTNDPHDCLTIILPLAPHIL